MARTRPYAEKHTYEYEGFALRTYTKSEARALLKKKLGLRPNGRLPVGAVVKTQNNHERSE